MAQARTEEQYTALVFNNAPGAEQAAVESWAGDMKIETATPRRGRKPIVGRPAAMGSVSAEVVEAAQAAAPAIAEIRANTVSMPKAELAQSLSLAQGLGMFQAFDLMNQFSGLARLKWLSERKQSGDYKDVTVIDRQGQSLTLNTFEDLCSYVGVSKSTVYEDLQNLALFGEDFMSTAESLGLGYRDLRLLRKDVASLSPEERRAILEEAQNTEGPEELKDKLTDLHAELLQLKADKKELEAQIKDKDKVSKTKNERLDNLQEQINRLTSMSPDDRRKALDEINAKARADVDKACQNAFVAAIALCSQCAAVFRDERSSNDACAYVHERVSLLMNNIADAVLGAGVDVDLRQRFEIPEDDEPAPAGESPAEPESADLG